MNSSDIVAFQSHIRKRRATNRRDLPWRKTDDPYKIWISETMLCQTQVSRVITYYNNWMRLFPTVEDLASASTTEVLSARSGLGYNSRGLRVLQAAKSIVNYKLGMVNEGVIATQALGAIARKSSWGKAIHNKGKLSHDLDCHAPLHFARNDAPFPSTYEDLIALPGVGDYVANAILAFAYNQDVAVIDTNIRRILIHQFKLDEKISLKDLKAVALEVLPRGHARERYNALMDYGALELTAKKSGIRPLTRQSKFEGSRRQVRARIVKEILPPYPYPKGTSFRAPVPGRNFILKSDQGEISPILQRSDSVVKARSRVANARDGGGGLSLDLVQKRFPGRDDIDSIVADMVKEGIVEVENGQIRVKS